jgi:hypothetical protein
MVLRDLYFSVFCCVDDCLSFLFFICWPLYYLSFDLRHLNILLTSVDFLIYYQWLIVTKLKSSFRMFYGPLHNLVKRYGIYVSQMTTYMFWSFPHSWLITGICSQSNTTGATYGTETRVQPRFCLCGSCCSIFGLLCVFVHQCIYFVIFLLVVALLVLRFAASGFPFGIFKVFKAGMFKLLKREFPHHSQVFWKYKCKCILLHERSFIHVPGRNY